MTAITVTNNDWTILSAIKTAIEAATIEDAAVFESADIVDSEAQANDIKFTGDTPRVTIIDGGTQEQEGLENEILVTLSMTLLVIGRTKANTPEARIEERKRLACAVKNAIEGSWPATATGFGFDDAYHPPYPVWGDIDATPSESAKQPWVAFKLPFTAGYGTLHTTR